MAVVDRESGGARLDKEGGGPHHLPVPDPEAVADDRGSSGRRDGPGMTPGGDAVGRRSGRRWGRLVLWAVAVLGVFGTAVFWHAWSSQRAEAGRQAQVRTVAGDFLLALTNFDAKSVDADFNKIQAYATGDFAKQSNQFFGSTIRQQLESALASSRGQIRNLYVQSLTGNQASVYAVIDQVYVNNKLQAPASDELRVVTDLSQGPSGWKIAEVTVLGNPPSPTTGSTGASGTAAGQ